VCGDPAGGTRVKISGSGFADKAAVKFGDAPAVDVKYVDPTTIQATVPAHGEGAVDVSVQVGSSTGTLPKGFTYTACPGQSTIILLVLLAGALGGTLHSIRSFYAYVGNRELRWSWVPMYAFRPLTGAALAFIFFLCVTGAVGNWQSSPNRFWIVGLSALVGLFSQQGFEKLKQIVDTILTPVPPAADHLKPASAGATGIMVAPATIAAGKTVTITGTGFQQGTTVLFGAAPANVQFVNPTTLSVTVPAGPQPGTVVDVVVTVPGSQPLTLTRGFTYA
jgi:hypothetical protein